MQDAFHLLNRNRFRAAAGEIERVQGIGPEKYSNSNSVLIELTIAAPMAVLAPLASIHMSTQGLIEKIPATHATCAPVSQAAGK